MRIRGSHDGEVARAAWNVFKRNGIIPSDDAHNARVENDGDNAGVGDEEPKAVLSLEERGVVLRLVKQVSVSVSGFRSAIDHSVSLLLSAPLEPNQTLIGRPDLSTVTLPRLVHFIEKNLNIPTK